LGDRPTKPPGWKLWTSWLTEFQKLEERCSRLKQPGARICDLLLGPPYSQARLANRLDEAAGQLGAKLAARREVNTELEPLWTLVMWVQDLVLDRADKPSSLAASLSTAAELLEGWVDALWILARQALDLLALHVLPSVARDAPDGVGE
jgi:hypothetical protein